MIEVRQYVDRTGRNRFESWLTTLDSITAVRITASIARLRDGNLSSVKGVGSGVFESRLHFGPGFRIYFGKEGENLILLLAGGTKKRQPLDIAQAIGLWNEYKESKTHAPDQELQADRRRARPERS